MPKKFVMVDLETLGTVPGCSILSIGAVEFDPIAGKMGKEFYVVVNRASCASHFLEEDNSTIEWWTKQGEEARKVLEHAASKKLSKELPKALEAFNTYLATVGTAKDVRVLGNGADFDNPILAVAYRMAKVKPGWASYNGRCYRTLKNLDEFFGATHAAHKIGRGGTYHNALDDAKSQAQHLIEVIQRITRG